MPTFLVRIDRGRGVLSTDSKDLAELIKVLLEQENQGHEVEIQEWPRQPDPPPKKGWFR